MAVFLIAPLCEHPRYPLYFPSENLGIGYIASYLRSKKIEVRILDANMIGLSAESVLKHTDITDCKLIGIASSSFLLINEAVRIAERIKSVNNTIHITVGGHFASFNHEEILKYSNHIDSVVRGEGEETMLDLYTALSNNKSLDTVVGLTFRSNTGAIVINGNRRLIDDLDSFPWPARDSLPFLQDLGHTWPTQITTSRGCYANCFFCDIRAFSGTLWRSRNPKDIVDEMEYLQKKYNSIVFRFTDDEFIGPKPHGPARAEAIADEIIKRNLKFQLMIDARAHMVNKDLFAKLKKAGVIDCLIGIESGVDRILRLYNKGITVETNKKAIRILRELGITLNLAFIMFDPRMTFAELCSNYEFLLTQDIVTTDSLKSWIWPLDGTPLKKQLIEGDYVIVKNFDEFEYRFEDPKVFKVFQTISACTDITFELERLLFNVKKKQLISKPEVAEIELENLELWKYIFINSLENPERNIFSEVKSQSDKIMNRIHTLKTINEIS